MPTDWTYEVICPILNSNKLKLQLKNHTQDLK